MESAKREVVASSDEAGRSVLLAEDDDALRALLATTLRRAGYLVQEFSSGSQLLCMLGLDAEPAQQLLEIGLIICDIRMPGASGIEVLTCLTKARLSVPVVLMTAFGDRRLHAQALKLGAAALIDKPFDLDELLSLTRRLLPSDRVSSRH